MRRGFGRALRARRLAEGLSQEELAYDADLTRNYIGELERGLKSPSLTAISALAAALDMPAHQLVREAEAAAELEVSGP